MRGLVLAAALGMVGAAPAPDAPAQMVGLFIQGCMPFVGDANALRGWALQTKLPVLPKSVAAAFLHGAPGEAFDGSNNSGKFALVSSEDGLCSVVTDQATTADMTKAIEAGFAQAGLAFRMVIERDDKNEASIHDREYLAARNGNGWRVLVATVKDGAGQAMLTAGPE